MSQYGAYGYALHGATYQAILAHYYQGTTLGQTNPSQTIRVLIATGRASFSGASAAGGTRLTPTQTYTVTALASGRLSIAPAGGKPIKTTFAPPLTVTAVAPITAGGVPVTVGGSALGGSTPAASAPLTIPGHGSFRGTLQFRPDGQGGVQSVNAVGLDDYVRGVVADEMPSGWAAQALEAQAVAARTYAITTTVSGDGYDLYDDTRSQMYGGVGAETAASDAAVQATRGQIVTYQGQPAVTYFFASSGGYTESIQNAWPGASPEPWLKGVSDPYDGAAGDPYHQWESQLSLRAAAAKLGGLVKGSLVGITVTEHGVSPRIIQAVVAGTRGATTVSGGQLQQAFGLLATDATFTTITTNATSTKLTGRVFPAHPGAGYVVQSLGSGGWRTIAHAHVSVTGTYSHGVPAPGTYRIAFGPLSGPAVTTRTAHAIRLRAAARAELAALLRLQRGAGPVLPMGRLARYAWPLAGHRRPLRPVPLVLRAARLDHRHR
jgi:stage II sporulation protein D